MGSTSSLEQALGYRFRRPGLLERALVHTSTVCTPKERTETNERLEFLGDRVLGLVVARLLYDRFFDEEEGELAQRHASLVSRQSLHKVAVGTLDLGPRLILSKGEEDGGGRANPSLLADACEAVIGALYLDGGLEPAETFIVKAWTPLVDADLIPPKDAKTELQEWGQGRGLPLPAYRVALREGPDHAPVFTVEVSVEGQGQEQASGVSKRTAEQAAAQRILARLKAEESGNNIS